MRYSPRHGGSGAQQWVSEMPELRRVFAADDDVDAGLGRDSVEVPGIDVAWAEHEPLRDAVEFDQCKRRRHLVGGGEQNGFAGEVM